jgi:hypothetical protein
MKVNLTPPAQQNGQSLTDPILITTEGIILSGFGRWRLALLEMPDCTSSSEIFEKQAFTKSEQGAFARLEARVEQLEQEIDRASGAMPAQFHEAMSATRAMRPGPRERMELSELLVERDNLLQWLEEHWPNIVNPLYAARTARAIALAIKKVKATSNVNVEWQSRLINHSDDLFDFLRSNKFRRKPPRKTVVDALRSPRSKIEHRAA